MSKNLVINGITYNGIESMEIPDTSGEKVVFIPEDEAGVELPELNPAASEAEIVENYQAIGSDGKVKTGTLPVYYHDNAPAAEAKLNSISNGIGFGYVTLYERKVYGPDVPVFFTIDTSVFGNAAEGDVRSGYTFTSKDGLARTGTAEFGSGGDSETVFYTYLDWGGQATFKMVVPYDGITWREYITYEECGIQGAYVEYDLLGHERIRVGTSAYGYPIYLIIDSPDSLVPLFETTSVEEFIP